MLRTPFCPNGVYSSLVSTCVPILSVSVGPEHESRPFIAVSQSQIPTFDVVWCSRKSCSEAGVWMSRRTRVQRPKATSTYGL
ncbi:hypothetical protein L596_018175 [Steinernema carpocapsae]|uniref:Uncharacterized protein n=1 Tax=Steinernema carpocapsae TaxID=34508 RepID=A0A4V6A1Y4_STECR|nr:hypothetical protein L596_018175 [Steinernema carpocapsae]